MDKLTQFADNLNIEQLIEMFSPFRKLMLEYECAILEVTTKLDVLNKELSLEFNRNPFESIKSRLKSPRSIFTKLRKLGKEVSVSAIEENLMDVAGIRVTCAFAEDIYLLVDNLVKQDDITLLTTKDYIKNPKPNGYRSLHLILEIPIFLSNEKKPIKIEVQFRTIAMDFWASVEHKLKYKKALNNEEQLVERLATCAEKICLLDKEMSEIRACIDECADEFADEE